MYEIKAKKMDEKREYKKKIKKIRKLYTQYKI